MKLKHLFVISLSLLTTAAHASSLVCANERLYSSNVRYDFGTKPPPGTVTGKLAVALDGKMLLSYTSVEGLHPQGVPPYRLSFVGDAKVLASSGGAAAGSNVFEQTAVLTQVDPIKGTELKELARETVVCRKTWAFPPAAPRD